MNEQTANIITIASAVLALIILIAILNWILGRILGLFAKAPALQAVRPGIQLVRSNLRNLLLLVGFVLVLAAVGGGAYLMVEGEHLPTYLRARIESVPPEYWLQLAIGAGKVLGLLVATAIVLRMVSKALRAGCTKAQDFDGIRANDESVERFFLSLETIVRRATWLGVLAISAQLVSLPEGAVESFWTLFRIYLIIAAGILVWRGIDAFIVSIDALSKKYSAPGNWLRYYDDLTHMVPVFRRTVEWALYLVVATLVVMQVESIAQLAEWGPRMIKIIGIIFVARLVVEVANLVVEEVLVKRADLNPDEKQRRLTIVPLIRSALKYLIYFTAGILILKQLEIDPTPILAGAGIVTLAIGLGAQNLINDLVSGFFILFENYYLVGDYIKANDAEGFVEAIDIRTTRVRDEDGRLHIIRNGEMGDVVNYSKGPSTAIVEVGVAYEHTLQEVVEALEEASTRISAANKDVVEPLEVDGLEDFGESELVIRTVTRTQPGRHLDAERTIREKIKEVFDERDIEIPYARRVMIHKGES